MKKAFMLSAILATFAAVACDGIVGADEDNFIFDSMRIPYDSAMVNNAEAFGLIRNIQIDGLIILPHPCHTLGGDYSRTGGQLTLTVTAASTNSACTAELTAVQYRLQTFGVPRGAYRVRVYHQQPGSSRVLIAETDVAIG